MEYKTSPTCPACGEEAQIIAVILHGERRAECANCGNVFSRDVLGGLTRNRYPQDIYQTNILPQRSSLSVGNTINSRALRFGELNNL